ncbi:MAG: hypothetical protein Q8M65_02040, partial [Rhodoglobus sp.]|nr:hypothetical protein [Rhodoglobus sp.]
MNDIKGILDLICGIASLTFGPTAAIEREELTRIATMSPTDRNLREVAPYLNKLISTTSSDRVRSALETLMPHVNRLFAQRHVVILLGAGRNKAAATKIIREYTDL